MPSFEVLLPVGAIAFYLFDAALMLYSNEFALELSRRRWQCSGGQLQLLGRRLFIPNPFAPGRLLFRLCWDADEKPAKALDAADLYRITRPLRVIASLQAFILLALLAPVSIGLGAGSLLLLVFAVFYLLTAIAIAVMIRRRKALGLPNRQCVLLALEIMACAPFAPNLPRKLTLIRSAEVDWVALACASFTAAEKQAFEICISERIEEGLAIAEPGSIRAVRLQSRLEKLQETLRVAVTG